jgi:hypothetical protein
MQVFVDACSGRALAADIPARPRAGRSGSTLGLTVAGFAAMVSAGAFMPTWWLAAVCIVPLAIVLRWSLTAGVSDGGPGVPGPRHAGVKGRRGGEASA